ncbi:hypothetical protein [Variovorax sp. JS1663]|uniref:hypothetical protein n=1 Tax=Variovorax sp. JS1663 TaxID=1851577 RepID=UPI000B3459DF|nr:hypothetical protein [Variovorax sp. JS1663]OUM04504.1 hypothetical protein A8M77_02135 [Variovorax sp. JS1663]
MRLSESGGASIEERLERLRPALDQVRCEDARQHRTELRKRIVTGGAVHHVQQCMRCGSQVGSPEPRPPVEPKAFDQKLVARHQEVMREYGELLREKARADLASAGGGDPFDPTTARQDARQHMADSVDELLSRMSEIDGETAALQVFQQRISAVKKRRRDELAASTNRFASEVELSAWLKSHLQADFFLHEEVRGRHLAEDLGVRIDFVAYPKQHLIDAGFEAGPFGIEVKYIDPMNGFSRKASRAFWQTVTYTDSEFYVGAEAVRLNFAMLFTNLGFDAEYKLLASDDVEQWHAFVNLAHHSRVARLEVKGTKARLEQWTIMFSSNAYFYRKAEFRTGEVKYWRPNTNALRKIQRVGNF